MDLIIHIMIGLIVIGLLYWVLTQIPLPPLVKQIGTVIIVVLSVLWLIQQLGFGYNF